MNHEDGLSILTGQNRHWPWPSVCSEHCYHQSFHVVFPPNPSNDSFSEKYLGEILYRSLEFSLCCFLFLVFCFFLSITLSCKVRLPWFLSFSSLSVQLSKSTGLYLDSQCLYIGWKLFWWGKLEQSQGFPYLFPGLNDHCPLLPDIQYLTNYCFIYFVQF